MANGTRSKYGVTALLAGAALLVPFAWSRMARAATKGKMPRLAREMPGMGRPKAKAEPDLADLLDEKAEPEKVEPEKAEPQKAEPEKAEPEEAEKVEAEKPAKPTEPVPEPPVKPPVVIEKPAEPEKPADKPTEPSAERLTTMAGWLDKYASEYKAAIRKRLNLDGPGDPTITPMDLCRAAIEILPANLIEQLKRDLPSVIPDLAICEKQARPPVVTAPAPPVAPPVKPVTPDTGGQPPGPVPDGMVWSSMEGKWVPTAATIEAKRAADAAAAEAKRVADAADEQKRKFAADAAAARKAEADAAAKKAEADAAAKPPEPEETEKPPKPAEPVPEPPVQPPVTVTVPEAAAEVSPPAPDSAQLATPKPPAGFDASRAKHLAPQLAKSVTEKKYDYSRKLAEEFQRAAGIDVDRHYGGETRSAIEAFGVRRPPRALFKPTDPVPYKWADYV